MSQLFIRKTILIEKDCSTVFKKINDFHHCAEWSPWLIADPKAKVNVDPNGKYYNWESPILGSGEMTIIHEEKEQSINCDLHFFKPWKSKAKVTFFLNPKDRGTEVVWTMKSSLPFYLFWMKKQMEVFVGMDYERGLLLFLLLWWNFLEAQAVQIETITFYNVENLFDSIDDPDTFDDDFTPKGRNHWTRDLLTQKINQLATVIAKIGAEKTGKPPLLLGLAEIENRAVLEQLIAHPKLRKYGFQIVHFDSPDARGIDVALLYRKSKFFLETVKKYSLYLVDPKTQQRRTSRDQLVLSGYWEGSKLAVSVNHWPSRRGGQKRSQASRLKAAHLQQRILDSIQRHYPEAYLISMGDFNDNPNNKSVSLLTQNSDNRQHYQPLVNPMKKLFLNGIGSLAFRDRWYLFDQILLSQNWHSKEKLVFLKAAVFNPSFLRNPEGKFSGYPYRNEIIGTKLNGYADHFPVYILVGKRD